MTPLDVLSANLAIAGAHARFGVTAPVYDAHVAAWHAERDRLHDERMRHRPRHPRPWRTNRC